MRVTGSVSKSNTGLGAQLALGWRSATLCNNLSSDRGASGVSGVNGKHGSFQSKRPGVSRSLSLTLSPGEGSRSSRPHI